ncbi:hypothetical protein LCGC14_0972550 [marine sediment metagenome]|uniref:Uncharacterized protein n=1 Tax=marine sediment metagenome TaxID=412755 RepID=A0A0F9NB99_9ZZZZ
MYDFVSNPKRKFTVEGSYDQIAGAAFLFQSKGIRDIWIYLVDDELKFHPVELKLVSHCLVAHYSCQKIIRGFSNADWIKLGRLLSKIHFSTNH